MKVATIELHDYEIEFLFYLMKLKEFDVIDTATREDIEAKIKRAVEDKQRGYRL